VKISIYAMAFETFAPMLRSLSGLLDKGAEHARAASMNPAALVEGRLAPDMYTLAQQVQLACDQAAGTIARLADQEPPKFESELKTIDDLKARIGRTLEYVQRTPETAFAGADDREIRIPIPEMSAEFVMTGVQFLRDWGLPHFYFHVVTAYDILRHNGVEIGKRDYLSYVGGYLRQLDKK
jgi:uncharacterized protein